MTRQFATDQFDGGAQNKVLKKNSAANYDYGWGDDSDNPGLPEGGTYGAFLLSDGDGGGIWSENPGEGIFPRMDIFYTASDLSRVLGHIGRYNPSMMSWRFNGCDLSLSYDSATLTLTVTLTNNTAESITVEDGYIDVNIFGSSEATPTGDLLATFRYDGYLEIAVDVDNPITVAAGASNTTTIVLDAAFVVNTQRVYIIETLD